MKEFCIVISIACLNRPNMRRWWRSCSVHSVVSPVMAALLHTKPASNRTSRDSCHIHGHDKRCICIMPMQRIKVLPAVPEVYLLHLYCYNSRRSKYEAGSYISAVQSSGFHGFKCSSCGLLARDAMQSCRWIPTAWMDIMPPSPKLYWSGRGCDQFWKSLQ